MDSARADMESAGSRLDTSINLEGILRSGRPSNGGQDFAADNSVRIAARKTLYDFGRSSNAEEAARLSFQSSEAGFVTALDKHRLEIMARYFDVLLADLQYTADNELMAVHYVAYDHGKDKLERGQISNLDLAQLESRYTDTLEKRNASAQRQRLTRALLANSMNRPGDLPTNLDEPRLANNDRKLPDYETLLPILMNNNSQLRGYRELLTASQKRMDALRADTRPTLDAELQASDYSRSASTRDNLSGGLILTWPLYQGRRVDSRISRERSQFDKLHAASDKARMELTQALLETLLDVAQLQSSARSAAHKFSELRDLQLEKSRGLYELELTSNLGTAMVGTAEANLRMRRVEYQLALGIARLEALIGVPLD
jgi:outer membrane protein TolC